MAVAAPTRPALSSEPLVELKDVFSKITIKRYTPRLSEDFELALYQNVNGVELAVPKSTGENPK